ncbi:RidA family protein [Cyclobacteriaceae bacterium]|jgi:enamine deaminase RidA (YjgF/YER057c/UK114 family)|nr:RidA family protein [Cyclobacteriaceae bacterium]MDB4291533.1 RidA family protein [Cyclobacteriaceae bacterium]MDB4314735.1 RidA family protein [Cyclobacteriaceae bacterium]MDB4606130.1 RidA family protein [Cyclobacteriaceae bacterium]MDB4741705.1 RidA family protein [Cyclobacteriaceae bacterium]|tara:strand:+ start:1244 stop:1774 length:531 start_codon:yes stop_codon:yes gene_type:complete
MKNYLSLLLLSLSSFSLLGQSLYDYEIDARLLELGITLNEPSKPVGNYVNSVRTGNLIYMAGLGPLGPNGYITGKLGQDLSIAEGYDAARYTAISQLTALKAEIGDLNKVKRIVKVFGMVNSTPTFTQQPAVINGFSDLMVAVFGDRGRHARAAVGMVALPMNICVEIEMIVEVEP